MEATSEAAETAAGDVLPEGRAKAAAVRAMFDAIAPRYDLVNRIMTLRMDVAWRRRTVASLGLPAGSSILDVACGTGDLCRDLAGAGHLPLGLDVSWGMLAAARTDAPLLHADALDQPVRAASLDGLTCGFALRNMVSLGDFLAEAARVLRPGGRMALLEVDTPRSPLLRALHGVYFGRVVPVVGRLFSDAEAYRYLPRSVAYLPSEEGLAAMLHEAGFKEVSKARLSFGAAQLVTTTRA